MGAQTEQQFVTEAVVTHALGMTNRPIGLGQFRVDRRTGLSSRDGDEVGCLRASSGRRTDGASAGTPPCSVHAEAAGQTSTIV